MASSRARVGWLTRIKKLEPLVTRATIVTVIGVVGMILNMQFSEGAVEYVVNLILAAFSLLTAAVTRPAVTPNVKVVGFEPNPTLTTPRAIYGEDQI